MRGCGPPRTAVDVCAQRASSRPPCLVSFSGGRDSAAVLAAASALARREGLPLPIPATYRFPNATGSHEDQWQEDVVRHLGLADWERMTLTDELDAVGPVARKVLLRHGTVWPFNAHFLVLMLERAAPGSLLTGNRGRRAARARTRWAARSVLSGRRRLRLRHVRTVGLALAPRPLRQAALAGRHRIRWPWLHPEVEADLNRRRAYWDAAAPLSASRSVGWWWQSRTRVVLSETFACLAAEAGTQLVQPFLEPGVMGAVAHHFGARGPADRSAAMGDLFADVLPSGVIHRRSKAFFDEAFFGDHSRRFVEAWDGSGIDPSLVAADRSVATWAGEGPDPLVLAAPSGVAGANRLRSASKGGPVNDDLPPHQFPRPVRPAEYHPPQVTYLGDLAELTQQAKFTGGADGTTFLGLDQGS